MKYANSINLTDLLLLINEPVYAIRNYHKDSNTKNFYISTMKIQNILISKDGVWVDTGQEIFHESELGNRFNLNKEEAQNMLEYAKHLKSNKISEIFTMKTKKYSDFD